ncbi:uncharacterized protein F4807DRAFT_75846 [Annulohypoxylon truncatum]|uniref:uncharacterized protein n=1 Tax=Annulohypoxylon truncatum TaxID=327061 RepID=UPI002008B3A8|nr:uncharacterized protein F4807DRAFT_75846 [Annulohypoxylon truncatum]KAI1209847.1 hypothetical protein F4807DRAFT_75846 [Annulohypoxylon truncatum]
MVQTVIKDDLEQLNSLHISYLDQLSQHFGRQFPNTPDQGRQYWEEFLGFVRPHILPFSGWRDSATYKPPFDLVSEFKELKIAELERKIARIESAHTTPRDTSQSAEAIPPSEVPQNNNIDCMENSNSPRGIDSAKPEPRNPLEEEGPGPQASYKLGDLKIDESVLQVPTSYSLESWYCDAYILARIAGWPTLNGFQRRFREILMRQTHRELLVSGVKREIGRFLNDTHETLPDNNCMGLSHLVIDHIIPRFCQPWPFLRAASSTRLQVPNECGDPFIISPG